jgi:hypothetical protein
MPRLDPSSTTTDAAAARPRTRTISRLCVYFRIGLGVAVLWTSVRIFSIPIIIIPQQLSDQVAVGNSIHRVNIIIHGNSSNKTIATKPQANVFNTSNLNHPKAKLLIETKNHSSVPLLLEEGDDHFSACLLVKDDNDILNEWIAYHYHVLKLRTLVLASDPSSKTSPTVVLNRWKSLMDIREWTDSDYMPDFFLREKYGLVPKMLGRKVKRIIRQEDRVRVNNHNFRQVTFLGSCIHYLKNHNKTWMVHIDTDEYMVLHPQVRQQSSFINRNHPKHQSWALNGVFLLKYQA